MEGALQHFIRIAKCGHVVGQCRCPGPKARIPVNELCPRCKASEPRADSTEDAIPSSEARPSHKDTPDTFWERMRMIHGDDVGP